ncbi:hypothetical protein Tco_0102871 [Tanacetum coccineum]
MDNTNPPPEVPPSFLIEKVFKLNSILESLNLTPQSSYSRVVCKKEMDSDVMLIELIKDDEYPSGDELNKDGDVEEEEFEGNHFDKFPTCSELSYHKYLMHDSYLSEIVRDPIIERGNPSNLKIPCNIGHAHIERTYIDLDSPLNIMRNFTYVSDFMIIEDISSVIDPRVSHVVLGKPFVELSDMTYDSSLGVNMKSVYLRNDEDKKKGVEYIMSKILGFYKECLELGPEYRTGQDEGSSGTSENQGGVTGGDELDVPFAYPLTQEKASYVMAKRPVGYPLKNGASNPKNQVPIQTQSTGYGFCKGWTKCCVHHKLNATVDAILVGKSPLLEIRRMDAEAEKSKEVLKHAKEPTQIELLDVEDEDEDMSFYFEDNKITKWPNVEIVSMPKMKKSDRAERLMFIIIRMKGS